MIPGRLVADALGPCDGTPEWWGHWTDLVTRAPAYDDEDYEGFARARGLDWTVTRDAFAPGYRSGRLDRGAVTGPLVRWAYRWEPGVCPTDSCAYRGGTACNGACAGPAIDSSR